GIQCKLFNPSTSVRERLEHASSMSAFDIATLHEMTLLGGADPRYDLAACSLLEVCSDSRWKSLKRKRREVTSNISLSLNYRVHRTDEGVKWRHQISTES